MRSHTPRPHGRLFPFVLCLACSMPEASDRQPTSASIAGEVNACGLAAASAPMLAAGRRHEDEHRCRQGRDAIAFGRKLIEYGVATLEYAVGLLLIAFGALFVAMGCLISVLEWVWC